MARCRQETNLEAWYPVINTPAPYTVQRYRKEHVLFCNHCFKIYLVWRIADRCTCKIESFCCCRHSFMCHQWESITKFYLFVCLYKPEMLIDFFAITELSILRLHGKQPYNARLALLFPLCHGLKNVQQMFFPLSKEISTRTRTHASVLAFVFQEPGYVWTTPGYVRLLVVRSRTEAPCKTPVEPAGGFSKKNNH